MDFRRPRDEYLFGLAGKLARPLRSSIAAPLAGTRSGPGYDPDALAYFTAAALAGTTLDAAHKTAFNDFFVAMKADGLLTSCHDDIWLLGNQAAPAALISALLLDTVTAVNSPTFDADRGYTGNGSTSYLNTGHIPGTTGTNFTQNSGCIWVYSRINLQANFGSYMGGANRTFIIVRNTSDQSISGINTVNFTFTAASAVTDSRGLFAINRSGATASQIYRNGSSIGTGAGASNSDAHTALYILAENNSVNVPIGPTACQIFAAGVSRSMDATEQANLYTNVQALATALGANV